MEHHGRTILEYGKIGVERGVVCYMLKQHQQEVKAPLRAWRQMQVETTDLQPHWAC